MKRTTPYRVPQDSKYPRRYRIPYPIMQSLEASYSFTAPIKPLLLLPLHPATWLPVPFWFHARTRKRNCAGVVWQRVLTKWVWHVQVPTQAARKSTIAMGLPARNSGKVFPGQMVTHVFPEDLLFIAYQSKRTGNTFGAQVSAIHCNELCCRTTATKPLGCGRPTPDFFSFFLLFFYFFLGGGVEAYLLHLVVFVGCLSCCENSMFGWKAVQGIVLKQRLRTSKSQRYFSQLSVSLPCTSSICTQDTSHLSVFQSWNRICSKWHPK